MAIQYKIQVDSELLRVTAKGKDDNVEQVKEYGLAIVKAAVENSSTKILCDETELKYDLKTIDTFESAKFLADNSPKVAKIAIVCDPGQISDAKFWETVAVNRGLQVKMCRSLQEATNWLDIEP